VDIWRAELGHKAPLIRVDIDPEVLSSGPSARDAICGDAASFLTLLAGALTDPTPANGWTREEIAAHRARWRAEVEAERPGILPVADALRDVLPEETLIYSDMTQFAYAAKEVFPLARPGLWHHPYGFGTLGYALPAAIGGKIGAGHRPVIAVAGDYGFQYTIQELMVAVELRLSLPILLWDNGKLGEIEDSMVRAQIAPNAVIQQNPDFGKLAEAYGAATTAPRTLAAFRSVVTAALSHPGPTLIHVTPETGRG
jgi:acetolactate synthase-1/2/3 large subunit/5-guanidino-2-oxopentanoate decarboxylase